MEWDVLTQQEFDRAVELLVQLEYGGHGRVEPVDGRGGDGGIDILLTRPDGRTTIFQLKHFPGGFSGKHIARRRQITNSLLTALKHHPDEWVLVVPCTLTRPDYDFIGKLNRDHDPAISVWHRARLDVLLTRHPAVLDLMQRDDYLLEQATVMGLEKAVLTAGGADLTERVAALGATVDGVDPDWTFDFERRDGVVVNTLRAKHPQAAERSPIAIRFNTRLDGHDDLHRHITRTLGFGLAGDVTLPGDVITSFTIDGPPLVRRGPEDGVQIRWVRPANTRLVGKPVQLRLCAPDGAHLRTHHGQATDGAPGQLGNSLQARFHGALTLTFLLPHDQDTGGTVTVDYDDTGGGDRTPAQVSRATQMALDLSNAAEMTLSVEGNRLLRAGAESTFGRQDDDWLSALRDLRDLAEDLELVQRHAGNHFPVPTTLSTLERIVIRATRLMLEGRCVMHPQAGSLTLTLTDPHDKGVSQLLNAEEGQVVITQDELTLNVAGHELVLPAARQWHPRMRLRDRDAVAARLAAGEEVPSTLESADGSRFRMFMPGFLKDEQQPLAPAPWGLPGVPECLPAQLDAVPSESALPEH